MQATPGHRLRALALATLAASTVALAGCASAVQQFRDSLNPVQQQIQTERSQIAATLQSVNLNDSAGARLLDQEIAALADAVAKMRTLRAPGTAAQRAFIGYQEAFGGLVAALYRVAFLVAHGTRGQLRAASVAATDATGAVQRGSDALQSALGP